METATAVLRKNYWNARGRWLVFVLAASSIACLLADFYRLCPMRIFTPFIFLPALLALFAFAGVDRWKGDGKLLARGFDWLGRRIARESRRSRNNLRHPIIAVAANCRGSKRGRL